MSEVAWPPPSFRLTSNRHAGQLEQANSAVEVANEEVRQLRKLLSEQLTGPSDQRDGDSAQWPPQPRCPGQGIPTLSLTDAERDGGIAAVQDAVKCAAHLLESAGVVCIENVLPVPQVQSAHRECIESWRKFYGDYVQPFESTARMNIGGSTFKEVVWRGPQRYDFRTFNGSFDDIPIVQGVLEAVLGDQFRAFNQGCVVSLPGADDGSVHYDSPHLWGPRVQALPPHQLNLFVPLVKLDPETGATGFAVGSHISRIGGWGAEQPDQSAFSDAECSLGSIVLFDCRIYHYGRGNSSVKERPIWYRCFAAPWFKEDIENHHGNRSLVEEMDSNQVAEFCKADKAHSKFAYDFLNSNKLSAW